MFSSSRKAKGTCLTNCRSSFLKAQKAKFKVISLFDDVCISLDERRRVEGEEEKGGKRRGDARSSNDGLFSGRRATIYGGRPISSRCIAELKSGSRKEGDVDHPSTKQVQIQAPETHFNHVVPLLGLTIANAPTFTVSFNSLSREAGRGTNVPELEGWTTKGPQRESLSEGDSSRWRPLHNDKATKDTLLGRVFAHLQRNLLSNQRSIREERRTQCCRKNSAHRLVLGDCSPALGVRGKVHALRPEISSTPKAPSGLQ